MKQETKRTLRIKVCGMTDPENIRDLLNLKPDLMGLIFYPGSKRHIHADIRIPETSDTQETINTGVFVNSDQADILEKIRQYNLGAIQLHGSESAEYCRRLRMVLTAADQKPDGRNKEELTLIKAFGIAEGFDWRGLEEYTQVADYFLFDTRSEGHGGTGQKFDWQLLHNYTLDKPYFLSGGIEEADLAQILALAAEDARLVAVDLNSRYEVKPGWKDINRLKKTFKLLRNGR